MTDIEHTHIPLGPPINERVSSKCKCANIFISIVFLCLLSAILIYAFKNYRQNQWVPNGKGELCRRHSDQSSVHINLIGNEWTKEQQLIVKFRFEKLTDGTTIVCMTKNVTIEIDNYVGNVRKQKFRDLMKKKILKSIEFFLELNSSIWHRANPILENFVKANKLPAKRPINLEYLENIDYLMLQIEVSKALRKWPFYVISNTSLMNKLLQINEKLK